MGARLRLRRGDGRVFLDRRGWKHDRVGGLFLHRMAAPDPGPDLHDHPWAFLTIPLWGGYVEQRADTRSAPLYAAIAEQQGTPPARGCLERRRPLRPRLFRLDECHQIVELRRRTCWTLVLIGPRRRRWGFYTASGWVDEATYKATRRRDVAEESP